MKFPITMLVSKEYLAENFTKIGDKLYRAARDEADLSSRAWYAYRVYNVNVVLVRDTDAEAAGLLAPTKGVN